MSGGRSDAVWSEQGTTPDAIEAALRELLDRASTPKTATTCPRACST